MAGRAGKMDQPYANCTPIAFAKRMDGVQFAVIVSGARDKRCLIEASQEPFCGQVTKGAVQRALYELRPAEERLFLGKLARPKLACPLVDSGEQETMSVPQASLIRSERWYPPFAVERKPQLGSLQLIWIG